jgi:hypothetical protein
MQKKKTSSHSLKVSLHGMNDRMQKMMASYLELSCKGIACVVDEDESQIELVDLDEVNSKLVLKERLEQQPLKPIIVLSLQEVSIENTIFVKKPIDIPHVIAALHAAKILLQNSQPISTKTDAFKIADKKQSVTTIKKTEPYIPFQSDDTATVFKQERFLEKEVPSKQQLKTKDIKPLKSTVVTPQKREEIKKKWTVKQQPLFNSVPTPKVEKKPIGNSLPQVNKPIVRKKKEKSGFSISILEIDRLLKELQNPFKKPKISEQKEQKNDRKSIRYGFEPVEANLRKRSFTRTHNHTVLVVNLSSRGALIETKKPIKLKGKVTLIVQLDLNHIYTIPAKVVRKEGKTTFGLFFATYQHDLIDELINTGHSFFFS